MAASVSDDRQVALEVAQLLGEHLAQDSVVLRVGAISSVTDYFVIATVRSATHLRSLVGRLMELESLEFVGRNARDRGKDYEDSGWVLLDCGNIVIHLMSEDKRDFYELERLWFQAEVVATSG